MPEIEEEANTSSNAPPIRRCLTPGRQALAHSMMSSMIESITTYYKFRRRDSCPTIYKIPQRIRQGNEAAYEPQIVSIGPYHNDNEKLHAMKEHKWLYLHLLLSPNAHRKLEQCLEAIDQELEDKARSYYSEKVGPQMGKEFVKMMVLDACFIVQFFVRATAFYTNDPIFGTAGMPRLIGYDLLLLENQIPFIVLQRIVEIAYPGQEFLAENARGFFHQFMPMNRSIEIDDSYFHLLHLFHSHLIPTPTDGKENHKLLCNPIIKYVLQKLKNLLIIFLPCSNEATLPITEPREMIPCATDLELAGVKFKKNKKSNNILDVEFSQGELKIPLLLIQDCSESLFRNLIAFEQCYPKANNHFTTYIVFMDCLVNTSNDVALLHKNGIIDNLLGSDDDVAHLFNRLCIGIFHTFEGSYLQRVKCKVQNHYENKWNMCCASWKRKYCTNPWSCISLIAATILLLFAFNQAFFTVFSYFLPRS